MNSSRSSSLVALLLVLVFAVGTVGAVSVTQANPPSDAAVGSEVTATFVLNDLYADYDAWTLQGQTELTNVTWTVETFNQAGDKQADASYDGQSFGQAIDIQDGTAEVHVSVSGTVPPITNYTYQPAEQFTFAKFVEAREGGTSTSLQTYETHPYTDQSRQARQAIASAQQAIDDAGGNANAERTLNSAISAYENANFANAVDLANQAQDSASKVQSSHQRTQLILYVIGAIVLVGLLVGVVIYWRGNRSHSRL